MPDVFKAMIERCSMRRVTRTPTGVWVPSGRKKPAAFADLCDNLARIWKAMASTGFHPVPYSGLGQGPEMYMRLFTVDAPVKPMYDVLNESGMAASVAMDGISRSSGGLDIPALVETWFGASWPLAFK
jgi:hypothetical protein